MVNDGLTLEDFANAAAEGTPTTDLAERKRRRKKNVLPKPSWLRVDAINNGALLLLCCT